MLKQSAKSNGSSPNILIPDPNVLNKKDDSNADSGRRKARINVRSTAIKVTNSNITRIAAALTGDVSIASWIFWNNSAELKG